jgi:acylphosphatase
MVVHFLIQGRVQGVGFRWYVQREAGLRDLRGWVRNTEEGEVEVMASGSPETLAELRASLRRAAAASTGWSSINSPRARPTIWIPSVSMGRGKKTSFQPSDD